MNSSIANYLLMTRFYHEQLRRYSYRFTVRGVGGRGGGSNQGPLAVFFGDGFEAVRGEGPRKHRDEAVTTKEEIPVRK